MSPLANAVDMSAPCWTATSHSLPHCTYWALNTCDVAAFRHTLRQPSATLRLSQSHALRLEWLHQKFRHIQHEKQEQAVRIKLHGGGAQHCLIRCKLLRVQPQTWIFPILLSLQRQSFSIRRPWGLLTRTAYSHLGHSKDAELPNKSGSSSHQLCPGINDCTGKRSIRPQVCLHLTHLLISHSQKLNELSCESGNDKQFPPIFKESLILQHGAMLQVYRHSWLGFNEESTMQNKRHEKGEEKVRS